MPPGWLLIYYCLFNTTISNIFYLDPAAMPLNASQLMKALIEGYFSDQRNNFDRFESSSHTTDTHMGVIRPQLLTLWPLGNLNEILYFLYTNFGEWCLKHLLWNCPNMNVIALHWRSVNIGSGNGLVPSGNKLLPEPMLTQISVAMWRH